MNFDPANHRFFPNINQGYLASNTLPMPNSPNANGLPSPFPEQTPSFCATRTPVSPVYPFSLTPFTSDPASNRIFNFPSQGSNAFSLTFPPPAPSTPRFPPSNNVNGLLSSPPEEPPSFYITRTPTYDQTPKGVYVNGLLSSPAGEPASFCATRTPTSFASDPAPNALFNSSSQASTRFSMTFGSPSPRTPPFAPSTNMNGLPSGPPEQTQSFCATRTPVSPVHPFSLTRFTSDPTPNAVFNFPSQGSTSFSSIFPPPSPGTPPFSTSLPFSSLVTPNNSNAPNRSSEWGDRTYEDVFEALRVRTKDVENLPLNKNCCRFSNILCPAETHVSLYAKDGSYLHANYVKLAGVNFILTQYPLPNQFSLFWLTCQNASLVVDLTNEKDMCTGLIPYAPPPGQLQMAGNLTIACEKDPQAIHKMRARLYSYDVKENDSSEKGCQIPRLHYEGWNDFEGISEDELDIAVAIMFKFYEKDPNRPLIMHCRAGVGRSGTVAVAYALSRLIRQNKVNEFNLEESIENLILEGRQQRGFAFVQSSDQLKTIYKWAKRTLKRSRGVH